jgi:N-acetylglucosamine-6-phosphate deacetylase
MRVFECANESLMFRQKFDFQNPKRYNQKMDNFPTLIENIQLYVESGALVPGWVLTEAGKISAIGKGDFQGSTTAAKVDGQGLTLLPGFIDLHTHGAVGREIIGIDEAGLQELTLFYAKHGVTGFLASPWTAPRQAITDSLNVIHSVMGHEKGSQILGAHLEGPWLNTVFCGAQDRTLIRTAGREEALSHLDSSIVKLVAVAPEIAENQWLIEECVRRGIAVAAGHTNATYAEMQRAVQMGVRQVTHCFNAMRPLNHREPGVVGAAMTLPELKCELIADNIHVNPVVVKLLLNIKGPEGVILITDSISAAGMPDGDYSFEGAAVTVKDGAARLQDGTLAGSTLTMERALANFVKASGRPLSELISCSSGNAAAAVHLENSKGKLAAGYDADLILVDQNLQVKLTMVGGKIVYREF